MIYHSTSNEPVEHAFLGKGGLGLRFLFYFAAHLKASRRLSIPVLSL